MGCVGFSFGLYDLLYWLCYRHNNSIAVVIEPAHSLIYAEGALNNAKRPSDDVVQTAPVKCRYTKSGICANIAGFCLCRQAKFALVA